MIGFREETKLSLFLGRGRHEYNAKRDETVRRMNINVVRKIDEKKVAAIVCLEKILQYVEFEAEVGKCQLLTRDPPAGIVFNLHFPPN